MHLVKKVSKELGLTYKELGEKIGYTESSLRQSVSKNMMSLQLEKAINMQVQISNLKKEVQTYKFFKDAIKQMANN